MCSCSVSLCSCSALCWSIEACIHFHFQPIYIVTFSSNSNYNFSLIVASVCLLRELDALRESPWIAHSHSWAKWKSQKNGLSLDLQWYIHGVESSLRSWNIWSLLIISKVNNVLLPRTGRGLSRNWCHQWACRSKMLQINFINHTFWLCPH